MDTRKFDTLFAKLFKHYKTITVVYAWFLIVIFCVAFMNNTKVYLFHEQPMNASVNYKLPVEDKLVNVSANTTYKYNFDGSSTVTTKYELKKGE